MVLSALSGLASSGLQSSLKPSQVSPLTGKARSPLPAVSAGELFSAGLAGQADQTQLTLKAMERDIKRLQGFKVNVTPADAAQLAKHQDEITRIEKRAGPEGLSEGEKKDRAAAYQAAYKILGKEFVDVEADLTLKDLTKQVDKLLEPKLIGAKKARLDRLRSLAEKLEISFIGGNRSQSNVRQLSNVLKQIEDLVPPRLMSELSPSEKRDYDRLVEQANNRAGVEMILPSRKRGRIEQIQSAMRQIGG